METEPRTQGRYRKRLGALPAAPGMRPAMRPNWFVRNKDALSAFQSLATIAALSLAFVWFQGQHQTSSKLKIEQSFSQRPYLGAGHLEGEILLSAKYGCRMSAVFQTTSTQAGFVSTRSTPTLVVSIAKR